MGRTTKLGRELDEEEIDIDTSHVGGGGAGNSIVVDAATGGSPAGSG
jgi:hypothetical protein